MYFILNIGSCSCNNRKVTKKLTEQEHFALQTDMEEKFSWDSNKEKLKRELSKKKKRVIYNFEIQQLCHR